MIGLTVNKVFGRLLPDRNSTNEDLTSMEDHYGFAGFLPVIQSIVVLGKRSTGKRQELHFLFPSSTSSGGISVCFFPSLEG